MFKKKIWGSAEGGDIIIYAEKSRLTGSTNVYIVHMEGDALANFTEILASSSYMLRNTLKLEGIFSRKSISGFALPKYKKQHRMFQKMIETSPKYLDEMQIEELKG